ncbi:hypothetical protein [Variovorax rhizosphaerae]|uniref:Type II toxin-antitoxin system Phd/YefM family antitoxin n=1 Tax=Variovorax rhizosphaerae TaxID=1836200 RepID=A0ABU8WG52_9BURK
MRILHYPQDRAAIEDRLDFCDTEPVKVVAQDGTEVVLLSFARYQQLLAVEADGLPPG